MSDVDEDGEEGGNGDGHGDNEGEGDEGERGPGRDYIGIIILFVKTM